jgi:hypothetical protein
MRETLRWVAQDGLGLAGAAAIGYGLWLIYEPAVWLWAGALLLVVAFAWAKDSRQE